MVFLEKAIISFPFLVIKLFRRKYMFSRLTGAYQDIPVSPQTRKCTDLFCCVFTTIFALAMFILALVTYIQGNLNIHIAPNKNSIYFNFSVANSSAPGGITSYDYTGFATTIITISIVCIGIGTLWICLTHLVPNTAPKIAIILAIVSLLVVAVFSFLVQNK